MIELPFLRVVREQRFVTQEELSRRSGIARCNISRLESGKSLARFSTAIRLADALDTSVRNFTSCGVALPRRRRS